LRQRKSVIIQRWLELARRRPVAEHLPAPYLADSMPDLIDELAATVENGLGESAPKVAQHATEHARQRIGFGYDIGQLVAEYVDLRQALQEVLADVDHLPQGAWHGLDTVIDDAVLCVMERFSRVREQTLRSFERISSKPLTAPNLDALLEHLVEVMAEVAPEVDVVTILLREGDRLQVRASRGLEEDVESGFSLAIGEGFAGKVAATRQPLLVRDAANDPLTKSEVLRRKGVRAIYGVPLVGPSGELVGVAHMGSTKASEFQEEDLILFGGVANRATALIASRRTTDRLLTDERQRERFMAVLGHDLRSPLSAVVGSAQMLLTGGRLEESDRRSAARIVRAGDRMTRLVGDLLDFTRARVGQGIPIVPVWVDLGETVRATVEESAISNPTRTIRVAVGLRSRVLCDPDRVAQVVSNLVGNALTHGAAEAPVDVRVDECDDEAMISVHNEGRPIPPGLLAHLFEPFCMGQESAAGVGLGLFIADAIVRTHGGSIAVRSTVHDGTTFTVRLPRERPQRARA
jgi:nitrogen-specific signal transduction histidine kinase